MFFYFGPNFIKNSLKKVAFQILVMRLFLRNKNNEMYNWLYLTKLT